MLFWYIKTYVYFRPSLGYTHWQLVFLLHLMELFSEYNYFERLLPILNIGLFSAFHFSGISSRPIQLHYICMDDKSTFAIKGMARVFLASTLLGSERCRDHTARLSLLCILNLILDGWFHHKILVNCPQKKVGIRGHNYFIYKSLNMLKLHHLLFKMYFLHSEKIIQMPL